VACDNNQFLCLSGEGRVLWRRAHHPGREQALAVASEVYFADREGMVFCYEKDGSLAWKASTEKPLTLFRLGDDVFGKDKDNRFWRFDPHGDVEPLDQGENLGRSYLLRTPSAHLVELNINGRTVTCLDLAGRIRWRFEAKADVSTSQFVSAGGLAAFRAGRSIVLLSLDIAPKGPGMDRGAFLEI
jgi:outer membrane protein assembly factor BamB